MMRKWLTVGIILLFVGIAYAPVMAQTTEKSLSSRGEWLYVGGNGPGNYTRIQYAIDDASDGDTIIVYSGTYYEHVNVNKQLFLKGTKLDGQDIPLIYNRVITIYNDSCSLENFSVQNHEVQNGVHVLSDFNIIKNQNYNFKIPNIK